MSKILNKEKFIEAKARGKNNTEAALEAGAKNKQAAYQAGYRLSQKTDIKHRVELAIQQNNITIKYLIKIYADAAKATKISIDKETGETYDSGIPDHTIRMKAADKLLQLSGTESELKQNKIRTAAENPSNWAIDLLEQEGLKQVTLTKQNIDEDIME